MITTAQHKMIGQKKKTPCLRFQGFSDAWADKKFGDIFEFKKTNSFSRDCLNYERGSVKNIHYGDIHTKFQTNFNILDEEVPYINDEIDITNINGENYCKEGDLVIADASEDYNDIGKTIEIRFLGNQKLVAGLHTYIARPKNSYFKSGFAGYLLQTRTVRIQVMMLAQGTKVLGISTKHLSEVLFKLPTHPEQQKIADFLSAIDRKIQQLTSKKELLAQYKKGVMQKIFSQEIRFKDGNGNDYPDWEKKRLGYYIKERVDFPHKPLPLYSLTIEHGMIPKTERYERSFLVKDTAKAYKVMFHDDFAFNPMNLRFGALARLNDNFQVSVSKYYNIFYCNEKADPKYFEFFLLSHEMIQFYNKMATGSLEEKKRVHYLDFVKFRLLFPCLEEQQKIASFLENIDKKIESTKNQITQTKKLKKGLMQQMFV